MLVPFHRRPRPQQYSGVRLMSTPTATTRAAPATSSLVSSTKLKTFVVTYAIVGTLVYLLCLQMNWPLFTFHPATNRIAFGWEAARSGEGPNMTWYGWTAMTLLVGAGVSFLATLPYTATCLAFLNGSAAPKRRASAPERGFAERPSTTRVLESSPLAPRSPCGDTDAVPYTVNRIAFMSG